MQNGSARNVDYDVIIVGAGLAGINFAYRLQERNPELTYCIVEGRHEVGGTWSLFKYPGEFCSGPPPREPKENMTSLCHRH